LKKGGAGKKAAAAAALLPPAPEEIAEPPPGLVALEQMGVGVPQVVPKIGGFREFCSADNAVLVEAKNRYYLPMVYSPVGGECFAVDPHDLCLGMEEYVLNTEKLKKHGEAARKTALSYTWERATESLIRRLRQEKEDIEAESS
jgi:glycosyltransferase involved in cell wall biosynthesis